MCHDCKHISNIIVSYYFPQYRQLWEVLLQLQNTPNDYIIVRIFLASFRKFCSVFQDNVFLVTKIIIMLDYFQKIVFISVPL